MRVAIAGAGIAGLTAAIALAARGFSIALYERAPSLEEVGAGIQLSPNATALLQRLGILDALRKAIVEPEAIDIRDARNGARLAAVPLGETARARYGAPYGLIHRSDLQAGLIAAARQNNAIDIHLNSEVDDLHSTQSGVTFAVRGQDHRADLFIAADGVRSTIRQTYFGHTGATPLGRTAWRATMPAADAPAFVRREATVLWLGLGGHLVHYPVRAGRDLNVVVIAGDEPGTAPPAKPFGRSTRQLIDAVADWTPWPLYGVDATRPWVRGRVVLIGDAAHAMAPSAAQGGAQAIEDAWVLAAKLTEGTDDPVAALHGYERARRARVERIVREARRNLSVYNMRGLSAAARNIVLGTMSSERLLQRLDWLYGWTPD